MASAPDEDLFDRFLAQRGHDVPGSWDRSYNKLQCPDCGGLHDLDATTCGICGWAGAEAD